MLSKIHYAKPSITSKEIAYATDAAANGWAENCFDYINRFSSSLKNYLNVPYVFPTSSCTGALHLAMAAMGIGPGDEVIAPDITWVASLAPVLYLGATPVLVDILPDTWCIDPAAIERAITPRTKAILAVHLYGNLCEMDEIRAIAKKHNLLIIEDAAEAIGSVYKGENAGSMGDASTFSFHGTKTVTTGEGGALIVHSKNLYDKIVVLESHGRSPTATKQFWAAELGYKYKMPNVAAALGVAQMERINDLVSRKREIFNLYKSKLSGVSFNPEKEGTYNSYWITTIVFDGEINRPALLQMFADKNIDARVFFYPLSMMPPFKNAIKHDNPVAYSIHERGINLPSYHDITEDEIDRVCGVIREYVLNPENT